MKYGVPIMAVLIWVMVAMVLSWHGNICLKTLAEVSYVSAQDVTTGMLTA